MADMAVHFSSQKQDWRTPRDLFDRLHKEHRFTLDGAAHADNHLLPRWWGPGGEVEDFLTTTPEQWHDQRIWLNPPYGRIQAAFIRKAVRMVKADLSVRCVMLLPARTDTKVFHECLWDTSLQATRNWVESLYFLKGRLKFSGAASAAPFPSMVVELRQWRHHSE